MCINRLLTKTTKQMKLSILLFTSYLLSPSDHSSTEAFAAAMRYNEAVSNTFRHSPQGGTDTSGTPTSHLEEIVRYATLAPSSHNTQCWKFAIADDRKSITVKPDFSRRCPAVDPDDHHLYTSLGCAVENLVIAAEAYGLKADVDSSSPADGIKVELTPCPKNVTPLFEAIPRRRVTRAEYNGEPLFQSELDQLKRAADGAKGVKIVMLTDKDSMEKAVDHITRANKAQVDNSDFRNELLAWIRFGEKESIDTGDGLSGPATGHGFSPRWIGAPMFKYVMFRADSENKKIVKQVQSSAGLAIIVSEKDDPEHWVEAGRVYERFALTATTMNVKNAFLNQPVEEGPARPEFAKAFNLEGRPDLVVRFGKGGPDLQHSLRRPLEAVLE